MDKQQYWKHHYNSFLKSGLTQREYCRQKDISYWTFNQWKRKFNKSDVDRSIQEIPVKISSEKASGQSFEIIFTNKLRLSVPDNFSCDTLKKILSVLGDFNEDQLG